jgi:two-component system sensor histidine kinase RegB
MGLGMFIAKTLLERSGATLTFANNRMKGQEGKATQPLGGAIVSVRWPRDIAFISAPETGDPLGENQQFS